MKRLLTMLVAAMLVLGINLCPLTALATVTTYSGALEVHPGNPRSSAPVYNYAWLDNIIIRDDAMAAISKEITPRPDDYTSSHTYDEFIKEADQYSELFELNEESISGAYDQIINAMYYLSTAMGMTDEYEPMRAYLIEYGISIDPTGALPERAKTAVVYAALKYNAVYALYGKDVTIPRGTTLDGAIVLILSALMGAQTPGDVNTIAGFAIYSVKTYVTQFEDLPISDDPDSAEVFYWAKVITAAGNDYQVPVDVYSNTTPAQKEYVDYAYYASIIETIYDVHVNPLNLVIATQSSDPLSLQKVILQTMLDTADVYYDKENATCEELFDLACENGYFVLENELYCDILKYDLTVTPECEKIWFTPFSIAGQVGDSDEKYVSMFIQDVKVAPGSTTAVILDPTKKVETITIDVLYDSPEKVETASYEFTVYKTQASSGKDTVSENDLLSDIERMVNAAVPSGNEKVDSIVDGIFENVDSALPTTSKTESTLTTYAVDSTTYAITTQNNTTTTERFDFEYLEELVEGVYVTDENGKIATTTVFDFSNETTKQTENQGLVYKAIETVQENPEIVFAPTGLVAVGALVSYFMNKKHRDIENIFDEDTDEE